MCSPPGTSVIHYFGNCNVARRRNPACLDFVSEDMTEEDLHKVLDEYTVFTFVRNPLTRAASAYHFQNDVWRSEKIQPENFKKPECSVDFGDYCSNPRILT